MKSIGKFLIGLIEFIVVLYAIATITVMMSTNDFGYREIGGKVVVPVDDQNIVELTKFKEGDLLLINHQKYNDLEIGDEVYYYATLGNQYIIVYGTIDSKEGSNRDSAYTVKENPGVIIEGSRVIGKLNTVKSGFGKIFTALTSSVGFLLLVILPTLLVFIYQVYNFILLLKEGDEEEEKQPEKKSTKKVVKRKSESDIPKVKE